MSVKKRGKKKSRVPLAVAMVLCLGVLGVSIYQLAGIYMEYKAGEDEYEELLQYVNEEVSEDEEPGGQEQMERVSFEELKAINDDIIGWIEIPETQISYPIMHKDDNAYYLNHTFRDQINSAGSIFMEALNSPDFSDYHTIIYGHNMKNGSMFAGLREYKSPSYLVDHPLIYVELEDGTHTYQIFSCYETEAESDSFTIGFGPDEQYGTFLQTLKERSLYDTGVEADSEDYVITLSTCTKSGEKRFLVHAKRI